MIMQKKKLLKVGYNPDNTCLNNEVPLELVAVFEKNYFALFATQNWCNS